MLLVLLLKLPNSNIKPILNYKLCPGKEDDNQLVATEYDKNKNLCEKKLPNFPLNLPPATGFADDKSFHLMANGKVVSFEKDAIGEKLGKPVPFTITDSKDFFIRKDVPGGGDGGGGKSGKGGKGKPLFSCFTVTLTILCIFSGSGSTWLVVIIIIVVLLLTAAAAAFVCCRRKNKTGTQGKGESGKGGKGKGKGK